MKCPYCGFDKIQPEFKTCPVCKKPLQSSEIVEDTPAPVPAGEKAFLARMQMPYKKAIEDPAAYGKWAEKNPNDRKKLWTKWEKMGLDLKPLMKYNPDYAQVLETAVEQARQGVEVTGMASSTTSRGTVSSRKNEETSRKKEETSHSNIVTRFANNSAELVKHKAIWTIAPGEIARHISASEFNDVSSNLDGVLIQEGVTAIVYVDGVDVAHLESGMYVFATEKEVQLATDQVKKEESESNDRGIIRNTISKVWRFLSGKKQGESKAKSEARKAKVTTAIRSITSRSTVDVYLKMNKVLSLPFGVVEQGGKLVFEPYKLKTRVLDVEAAVTLQVEVSDFKEFIASYLTGKQSATIADLQQSMNNPIKNQLTYQFRNLNVDQYGLSDEDVNQMKQKLMNVQNLLHGLRIVEIESITVDNHDFDRIRKATAELYLSEGELDLLHKTNEFKNRLATAVNTQKVTEAETDLELKKVLDEINKDGLLHEEEMEKFFELLKNQKQIRQATNKAELDKALSEIRYNSLVSEDEYEALVETLEDKKFDRKQVSEVMRLQSLSRTALAQLELNQKLSLSKLHTKTEYEKEEIYAGIEVDDAKFEALKTQMGRDAEQVDLEAAIYGRKFVLEKQKALDRIELEKINASHENEMLDYEIDAHKKMDDYKDSREELEYQRNLRKEEDDYARQHRSVEDAYAFDKRKADDEEARARRAKFDDIEVLKEKQAMLAANARLAMETENQQLQHEERKLNAQYAHEEELNRQNLDVKKEEIAAEAAMSAEQLQAKHMKDLDAAAQVEYMKSLGSDKENAILREAQERELEAQERRTADMKASQEKERQFMADMMSKFESMAKTSMETTANVAMGVNAQKNQNEQAQRESYERIATAKVNEARVQKDEYKEQMMHEQNRVDKIQDRAMNYTTRITETEMRTNEKTSASGPQGEEYSVPVLNAGNLSSLQVIDLINRGLVKPEMLVRKGMHEDAALAYDEFYDVLMKVYGKDCPDCGNRWFSGSECPGCGKIL